MSEVTLYSQVDMSTFGGEQGQDRGEQGGPDRPGVCRLLEVGTSSSSSLLLSSLELIDTQVYEP